MEVEDATENEISDPEEDDLTDSQQTNKLSELYCTTIPSVDSAMESWDGSGLDAGYGSQGQIYVETSGSGSVLCSNKQLFKCVVFLPLQAPTVIREPVSHSTPASGAVPSSAAQRPLLDKGRTTRSVMGASVRMTGTNHQGMTEP